MARKSRKPQAITAETTAVVMNIAPLYNTAPYARLSVEDNHLGNSDSIEAQKEMLLRFVEEQEDMAIYDVYCDNGFTGSNFDRDDFRRMMDDIKEGKVNCVVVKDLSRFGRDYIETGNYIEKIFPFMGVRFISINDGYDSNYNSPADIMVALRNIVNHAYVTDIAKKTKAALATKQKNGDFIGGIAPYGYLIAEDNNNKLIIDPETAPIVKQIYEWKADGIRCTSIARKLNEMGIPSPLMQRVTRGHFKTPSSLGCFWNYDGVARIIKSPAYAGHMAQHKCIRTGVNGKPINLKRADWIIVRDTHEAIISEELWNAAQITKADSHNVGLNDCVKSTGKTDNIFKGILVCPYCHKTMKLTVILNRKTGAKFPYYYCITHPANPDCKVRRVSVEAMKNVIFAVVKKMIADAADVQKLLDKIAKSKSHLDRLEGLRQSIRDLNTKLKRNVALKNRLFDAYGDELINEQEFRRMKDEYTDEARRLQSELADLEREYDRLTSAYSKDNKCIASFLKFKNQKSLTKDILSELIEKVIVHSPDSIEIIWRFADEYKAVSELAKAGEQ